MNQNSYECIDSSIVREPVKEAKRWGAKREGEVRGQEEVRGRRETVSTRERDAGRDRG